MSFSPRQSGLGILEYLLIIVIIILVAILLIKLFGPAVNQFVEQILKNV
jgi:hypothetical protein